ncbi:MAG: HAD family hydrolase [Deltaproteobacteria bacterium]|nr:HAD family hydrolase [Deltaproteobacteria bacterium]
MKPIARAVIFDLDGTLVNSLEDLADCVNTALAACSLPAHPLASYKYFVGMGLENLIRSAVPAGTTDALRNDVAVRYRAEYSRHWARKSRPYDGILPMLERLEAMRVPMAVLSNKSQLFTGAFVKHFFPSTPVLSVQGSPAGGTAKPDPAMALGIAARMGLDPGDIAFMGDTCTDMDTAGNAGMLAVGVTWGFRPESELVAHGVKVLLHRPEELFTKVALAPAQ